ncbi:MAG TPA: UvrB/UvrC motif-containing protein [Gemmatimonadales bacterium]|jgi:protein arginine kinase activator
MPCEQCGERPSSVHLTQIVNGEVTTIHLCDVCAEAKGVQTGASIGNLPLAGLLGGLTKEAAAGLLSGPDTVRCDFCGAGLREFRDTGRLGCSHCYDAFESQLRDLLRRVHGSSHHAGEVYLSPVAASGDRPQQLAHLREQLRRAVEAENFELCAELRDRIRALE